MVQIKVFINNTISFYCMNIVKLLLPLLTIPYLTRIFSTDAYGVVIYVKALMTYAQLVIDFGFMLSATKDIVSQKNKEKIGLIVGDTLIEKFLLALIVCLIFVILSFCLPIIKNNFWFVWASLFSILSSIFILDFLFRGLEKMYLIAIPYSASKIMTTFFTFILVKSDTDLFIIPVLDFIGNILVIIVSWILKNRLSIDLSFSNWRKWFSDISVSFLFFLSNFATTIFGAFTTILAGAYLDETLIAYWGICMQLLSAAKSLYSPLTNSLYTQMIKFKSKKLIKKIRDIMIIPMGLGTLIILFFSNNLMSIIGGDKYSFAGVYLIYLIPAFIFSFYSMLYGWPVLGAIGKYKLTTLSTIIAAIIQVIGMCILIVSQLFTLKWLAIICSFSELALFIIRYFFCWINREELK